LLPFAGQADLPKVCQICDHTPLNQDECKINSSMRTTVTVFLRTAEKKYGSIAKQPKTSEVGLTDSAQNQAKEGQKSASETNVSAHKLPIVKDKLSSSDTEPSPISPTGVNLPVSHT
jgi:hypothetical protein